MVHERMQYESKGVEGGIRGGVVNEGSIKEKLKI